MKHESACASTLTTVADGFNFRGNLHSTFWLWVLTLNFLIAIKVFDGSIKVFEVFESFSNCGAKKIDKFCFFKFSQFKRILEPCINSFQIILEKRCFIRILKKKKHWQNFWRFKQTWVALSTFSKAEVLQPRSVISPTFIEAILIYLTCSQSKPYPVTSLSLAPKFQTYFSNSCFSGKYFTFRKQSLATKSILKTFSRLHTVILWKRL